MINYLNLSFHLENIIDQLLGGRDTGDNSYLTMVIKVMIIYFFSFSINFIPLFPQGVLNAGVDEDILFCRGEIVHELCIKQNTIW